MKKSILSLAFVLASIGSQAGGLVTNTNQNAAFLRNFAQEGQYGEITAIYANPAGGAFLRKGWHLSLNNQVAIQERDIMTTFPLFQYNTKDHNATHKFDGDAQALVIPSFTFSYNWDRWSISAHFAVGGGGGKCEFDNGLGSFESAYAASLYSAGKYIEAMGMGRYGGYTIGRSYMRGSNYFYGLQVGGTYKILDNLSAFVGIRGVYATANYNGFVSGVTYDIITPNPADPTKYNTNRIYADADMSLNCDQHGFGVTPILGIDWKINDHWNVSAKYEFKTRIRLKNSTSIYTGENSASFQETAVMKKFKDGDEIKEDIPGILAIGAQYSPIKSLKIGASYHWYQDSEASKFEDLQQYNHDSHEVLAGIEWRTGKWITVSGSWQKTMYNVDDEGMSDVSFNLSSNSMGLGMRIHCTKDVNVDFSYMKTFYQDRTVTTALAPGLNKTDTYHRTNDVMGMAVNMSF